MFNPSLKTKEKHTYFITNIRHSALCKMFDGQDIYFKKLPEPLSPTPPVFPLPSYAPLM